jgi:hypothetical protein
MLVYGAIAGAGWLMTVGLVWTLCRVSAASDAARAHAAGDAARR